MADDNVSKTSKNIGKCGASCQCDFDRPLDDEEEFVDHCVNCKCVHCMTDHPDVRTTGDHPASNKSTEENAPPADAQSQASRPASESDKTAKPLDTQSQASKPASERDDTNKDTASKRSEPQGSENEKGRQSEWGPVKKGLAAAAAVGAVGGLLYTLLNKSVQCDPCDCDCND